MSTRHKGSNGQITSDVLIIGSGIAGLSLALDIVEHSNYHVSVITKTELDESNTKYAQGGIASVLDTDSDTFALHMEDTQVAGVNLCHSEVMESIISKAPSCIQKLRERGVDFDHSTSGELDLGREGGHHARRVAHVKDFTGLAIENALVEKVRESKQIQVYEQHIAIDLVAVNGKIAGCYSHDRETGIVHRFSSHFTVIATGGAGKVFLYTTNPDVATGDGIAMAFRAGAIISNMEFVQFHPTLYYNPDFRTFLISEAMRGEGAILKNMNGERFMVGLHEMAELAPRDIVARAIDNELKRSGKDYVLLDISHKDPEFVKSRFPKIYTTLLEHGTDITKEPIPIVPGAHYTIGGIKAGIDGTTNIPGLLAIGEASNTGFHGANRLASNSLLEAAVTATNAARYIVDELGKQAYEYYTFPKWEPGTAVEPDEVIIISHNWDEIRKIMHNYVGIMRSTKRLLRAKERLKTLATEVREYYWDYLVTPDIIELRNVVDVARLIVESALARKESRGTHYNLNYPDLSNDLRDIYVQKFMGVHFSELVNKEK